MARGYNGQLERRCRCSPTWVAWKSFAFSLLLCSASFIAGYNWRLITDGTLSSLSKRIPILAGKVLPTVTDTTQSSTATLESFSEPRDYLKRPPVQTPIKVSSVTDLAKTVRAAPSSALSPSTVRSTNIDPKNGALRQEQLRSSTTAPVAVKPATDGTSNPPSRPALILFMQDVLGSGSFGGQNRYNPFAKTRCPYSSCEVTMNASLFNEASLIIMPALWSGDCCSTDVDGSVRCRSGGGRVTFLPRPRSNQSYMFYNRESVSRTTPPLSCFKALDAIVNYTWTYKLDSDAPNTYGGFRALSAARELKRNYSAEKSKDVLWYVGNCHGTKSAKIRWHFAQNLSQYIGVDIFGRCSGRSDGCNASNTSCVRSIFEQYRYYLSLENSACKDYVTEKLFTPLIHGSVPIVRGLSKEAYTRLTPPHSFIHLDDYKTEADLASYLRYLSSNSTAYNEYHAWRAHYQINTPDKGVCKLCQLASTLPARNFNITAWWNASTDCSE